MIPTLRGRDHSNWMEMTTTIFTRFILLHLAYSRVTMKMKAGTILQHLRFKSTILARGEQNSVAGLYPRLFDSLRVLIYNGIYDMDCNFMGTDAWINELTWSGSEAFKSTVRVPWVVDTLVAGHIKHSGNLTQLLISGAGHLVPMDQPYHALIMLDRFLDNDLK